MQQAPPTPPENLKPWYYQYWFLYPVIVFWPAWPVLILRSPWHNGLVSGAVAWAMLIVGGYLIGWEQLYQERSLNQFTTTIIIPGLVLTVVTQILWLGRDRKRVREAARQQESLPSDTPTPTASRQSRSRRRGGRRSRAGRTR